MTAFKHEYLFPLFYPFKIIGVKQISEVLEISVSCPSVFYYSDNEINLLNDKLELEQILSDQVTLMCSKEDLTNPFRKNNTGKKRNPDFAYEIEATDLLSLNYERYIFKHSSKDVLLDLARPTWRTTTSC
jgi:hypothetical protein